MGKHIKVHSWCHKYGCFHREVGGDKHIVGHTVSHLPDGAGCSRGNDHRICPKPQIDVAVPSTVALREELADDGFAGQCRKGDGCNEFFARRGDDHLYFSTFLDKCTYEYSRFVGGYTSGYT